jgi:apolipoprotein D and lipocalin family protein
MFIINFKRVLIMSILASVLSACATNKLPSIATVPHVDLSKFMGDWYVIAAIPTMIETKSYNAIENYKLNADGTIATTFTFNKGSLDGEFKTYRPHGFILKNSGNALWGNEEYTQTIIARNARDYVWIMARTPTISDAEYTKLTSFISNLGYDLTNLRKVPHNAIKAVRP